MEDVMRVADYIASRYFKESGFPIDEMKLHKLLYFAQKESFVQRDKPLFEACFYGWKYGPVLRSVRDIFMTHDAFPCTNPNVSEFGEGFREIMDRVFSDYAHKTSWSLSRLTHGEMSWKQSREGIAEGENGNRIIQTELIQQDAAILRERRKTLAELGIN